jgi:hypothetical protein
VRFGDGERAICAGEPVECTDGWKHDGSRTQFAVDLDASLRFNDPNYYIGISDGSVARNESFRHARGEWIFWTDSDDVMDSNNGLGMRQLALGAIDPSILGITMKVRCPSIDEDGMEEVTEVDQVKLVLNLPELRWDRRIHEQIIPSIRLVGGEIAMTDLFVTHAGADQTEEGRKLHAVGQAGRGV